MSITISNEKCIGCGKCQDICPGSLIKANDKGKAYIKYPTNCWGCCSCIKECPKSAISLYLGADIGGRGSGLTVQIKNDIACWKIKKFDGTEQIINIDRKNANKY